MGGLWQALVFGFAGVRPRGDALRRRSPAAAGVGTRSSFALRFRGSPLRLRIDRGGVELDAAAELDLQRRENHWEVVFR